MGPEWPEGLILPHPLGVVINPLASIGSNCVIYQGVTIGSRKGPAAPSIGDRVVVWPGAVVLGDIVIGSDAQIGPNAVVINDVAPGVTVVGNPARPL